MCGRNVKEYYDTRAPEYDEWYLGLGKFAQRARPGWNKDLQALAHAIAALPPANTLDLACGTGYLTRHLRGEITGLDQSERMLAIAAGRLAEARTRFIQGDALAPPFPDGSFERVFTGHFYGHLDPAQRARLRVQARRLAPELIVVDSAVRADHDREERQQRVLNDGSSFDVYKRYFDAHELAAELGGGTVLHSGPWFVMVAG